MMPEVPAFFFFHTGYSDLERAPGARPGESLLAASDLVGGKGASLHALSALGFRVPAGFTIPVRWCEIYFARGERLPQELRDAIAVAVRRLEELTGRRLGAEGELKVAVRSGAAESMPGMMDTLLDVDSLPAVEAAIGRVFESWRSERAVAYRRERGIIGLRGTAVTVQEMCPAEAAGVAFTMDPGSGEPAVVIEAVPGLGEDLVSGAVSPDRVRFSRPDLEAEAMETMGKEPVIGRETAREVARQALAVEERFGFPVDLEWAIAGGEVHLLQARAIRRAREEDVRRSVLLREVLWLTGGPEDRADPEAWFARHNLDESLSHPTPMTRDLLRSLLEGPEGLLGLYRDLGFRPSERVLEKGFVTLIAGRLHAECGLAAEVFFGSDVLRHDIEAVRRDPALLDAPPRIWSSRAATPAKLLRAIWHSCLSRRRLERLRASFVPRFHDEVLPRWAAWCRERAALDLSSLEPQDLLEELRDLRRRVFAAFPREALKLTYLAGMAHLELVDFLERRLGDEEGRRAAQDLVGAVEGGARLDHGRAILRLIRGEIRIEEFLETHGHRGECEMELSRPRWREDPVFLLRTLESLRSRDRDPPDRSSGSPASPEASVIASLGGCGPEAVRAFKERLKEARELLPWREEWKHHWMLGFGLVRRVLLELDRRLGLEGQIFYLEVSDLEALVREGGGIDLPRREVVRRRREEERVARSLDVPELVTARDLERLAAAAKTSEGMTEDPRGVLQGTPIASGSASGRAWVCNSPRSAAPGDDPYVLVCPSTDPGWTPLLAHARALIVERGGALSHGAIVCRDFGVPGVVLARATTRIRDGQWLRVDGGRGLISKLDEREEPPAVGTREGGGVEQGILPEPWVEMPAPRPGWRAARGLVAAVLVSLAILWLATFPPVGDALRGLIAPALDWTLRAGFSPFASIAWAAAMASLGSVAILIFLTDRRRLRGLGERLAWYRREIRKRRPRRRSGGIDPAALEERKRAHEKLERRSREASLERTLELLGPIGWTCVPFALVFLWVEDRFPAYPIRQGTVFEVEAFFEPRDGNRFLRFARLDVEESGILRLIDEPYRPVELDPARSRLGQYHATWSVEALKEARVRMTVTARDSRQEAALSHSGRHELMMVPGSGGLDPGEITALRVKPPPLLVLLPDPIFRGIAAATRWITGGREMTPSQAAFGPLASFILMAVLFTLILQRIGGLR